MPKCTLALYGIMNVKGHCEFIMKIASFYAIYKLILI